MYIVIAGAGLVGGGLTEKLLEARHNVVVVDRDKDVCEQLAARSGALVLHGSATDIGILEQAGMDKADVAISSMAVDADNLSFSLLAKGFSVPRIIARMRDPRYASAYEHAGVTATVDIVDVFVNQILLAIDEPHLRQIATFGAGRAAIVVDTIPAQAKVAEMTVSQIAAAEGFPSECVISGIYRPDTQAFLIPRGSARILSGDRVFLVAGDKDLRRASKFLHQTK